jgi:hypothetical protein
VESKIPAVAPWGFPVFASLLAHLALLLLLQGAIVHKVISVNRKRSAKYSSSRFRVHYASLVQMGCTQRWDRPLLIARCTTSAFLMVCGNAMRRPDIASKK